MDTTTEHELEIFKAQLQKELEIFRGEIQVQVEAKKSEIDAHYDHWRMDQTFKHEAYRVGLNAQTSAVMQFAIAALRGVTLINGGAAIAILAFLGQIWTSNDQSAIVVAASIRPPMTAFVIGAFCGVLATGAAYLAQLRFAEDHGKHFFDEDRRNDRLGVFAQIVAIVVGFTGVGAFGSGALGAVDAFTSLPAAS